MIDAYRNEAARAAVAGVAVIAAVGCLLGGCRAPDAADSPSTGENLGAAPGASASGADSTALVADLMLASLGGPEAWEETRFLAFRWILARNGEVVRERAHTWDRYDGRYQLEFEQDGRRHVSLFNVNEVRRDSALGKVPLGDAWVDGQLLTGAARDSALRRAYGAFINDTYWLLMPFKWRDPGVHLAYEGRRSLDDGREYGVMHLTFEPDLGVTEDQYWGFVDLESGRMVAWQYHLQGQEEPGSVIYWKDWRPVGSIWLAADREFSGSETRIYFEGLRAGREVPEGVFAPPGTPVR
jgi:hypothetical protein